MRLSGFDESNNVMSNQVAKRLRDNIREAVKSNAASFRKKLFLSFTVIGPPQSSTNKHFPTSRMAAVVS
jgi:hypothetical protein